MIRVIHLGLGDIGKATISGLLAQSKILQLVGVVDINPAFAGKTLRDVLARRDVPALPICSSIQQALTATGQVDVATITTSSRTDQVQSTLEELIDAGIHVVSSCEELAFPNLRSAKITAVLDKRAQSKGVAILGTGVNPGFAMDAFALACTAPCTRVNHIKVIRCLDAAKRRYQLQKKVAAGMSVPQVRHLIRQSAIGHVGLGESIALLAAGLGWKLSDIKEKFEPVRATRLIKSRYFHIRPGQVRGLLMTGAGFVKGKKLIELELTMAFGEDTFDEVIIDGDPSLVIHSKSGFPGEASTVGLLVNCVRVMPTLNPGVRTMMDILRVRSVGA